MYLACNNNYCKILKPDPIGNLLIITLSIDVNIHTRNEVGGSYLI